MSRDDYLVVLHDMETKYNALGKAIICMRGALQLGCFTDPVETEGAGTSTEEGND